MDRTKKNKERVLLALWWALVAIPLSWGILMTMKKAMLIFSTQ